MVVSDYNQFQVISERLPKNVGHFKSGQKVALKSLSLYIFCDTLWKKIIDLAIPAWF
jgi:hypothetical protein